MLIRRGGEKYDIHLCALSTTNSTSVDCGDPTLTFSPQEAWVRSDVAATTHAANASISAKFKGSTGLLLPSCDSGMPV